MAAGGFCGGNDLLIRSVRTAEFNVILDGVPEQITIFYKGIMPSEKVLDFPVDCNTLTGSVNL